MGDKICRGKILAIQGHAKVWYPVAVNEPEKDTGKMIRVIFLVTALVSPFLAAAEVRYEDFNADPLWEGFNNFSQIEMRPVV